MANQTGKSGANANTNAKGDKSMTPEQRAQMEKLKKTAQRYQNKSEGELMRELKSAMDKGKADGSLNDKQIEAFRTKVSPLLTPAQRTRLNSILKNMK